MIECDVIQTLLNDASACEVTRRGTRVITHCLYPSFEQVAVFITTSGNGFVVSDGGDAIAKTWLHGRDHRFASRRLKQAALHFGCEFKNDELRLKVPSKDWLPQSIVAVANAAAEGANAAVEGIGQSTEQKLVSRIQRVLEQSAVGFTAKIEHPIVGMSGKTHRHDLLVEHNDTQIIVDVVVPHHNSVASKYLALSDTAEASGLYKYAVFERELEASDKVLLSNVADVLPYKTIAETSGTALLTH